MHSNQKPDRDAISCRKRCCFQDFQKSAKFHHASTKKRHKGQQRGTSWVTLLSSGITYQSTDTCVCAEREGGDEKLPLLHHKRLPARVTPCLPFVFCHHLCPCNFISKTHLTQLGDKSGLRSTPPAAAAAHLHESTYQRFVSRHFNATSSTSTSSTKTPPPPHRPRNPTSSSDPLGAITVWSPASLRDKRRLLWCRLSGRATRVVVEIFGQRTG